MSKNIETRSLTLNCQSHIKNTWVKVYYNGQTYRNQVIGNVPANSIKNTLEGIYYNLKTYRTQVFVFVLSKLLQNT